MLGKFLQAIGFVAVAITGLAAGAFAVDVLGIYPLTTDQSEMQTKAV